MAQRAQRAEAMLRLEPGEQQHIPLGFAAPAEIAVAVIAQHQGVIGVCADA